MPNRYTSSHQAPNGPGDSRPTAIQIVKDQGLQGTLSDKTFLVTGVSSGLGVDIVKALAATGATTYGTARDLPKAKAALTGFDGAEHVRLIKIEFDKLESVRAGAADFLKQSGGKLNVLVANAGVAWVPHRKTADGFETQFGVNHVGHFLLFQLLKDALLASSTPMFNSRVVTVGSAGFRFVKDTGLRFDDYNFEQEDSYDPRLSYGQSKLANIYMANHIERLYGSQGLHGIGVHPGVAMTEIVRHVPQDTLDSILGSQGMKNHAKSCEQCAATPVICAVGRQFEGVGGRYVEDCDWGLPETESVPVGGEGAPQLGYTDIVHNQEGEERLWKDSLVMVKAFV